MVEDDAITPQMNRFEADSGPAALSALQGSAASQRFVRRLAASPAVVVATVPVPWNCESFAAVIGTNSLQLVPT